MHKVAAVAVTYQPYIPRVAALFAIATAISLALYGTFLLEAVLHTASRSSAERQIQSISEKLSALETQYLAQTQSLTPQEAAALGYVVPRDISQVYEEGQASSLSLATPTGGISR